MIDEELNGGKENVGIDEAQAQSVNKELLRQNSELQQVDDIKGDMSFSQRIRNSMFVKNFSQNVKKVKSKDVFTFVFCILVALIIWIYVVNANAVEYEKTFALIPVEIEGVDVLGQNGNMSIIDGYNNRVNITVRGKKSDINKYTEKDLYAYIDVSGITTADRYQLTVYANELEGDFMVTSIEPSTVSVYTDRRITVEVETKVDLVGYDMNSSYEITDKLISVEKINVTGPKTVLDTVAYAAAKINAGTLDTSKTIVGTLELYDENGILVENPYIEYDQRNVSIDIKVAAKKEIALKVDFDGLNADDYKVTIDPATVTVKGDPQILDGMNAITILKLGANGDAKTEELIEEGKISFRTNIITIPQEGVSLVGSYEINITVEKIQKAPAETGSN